MKCENCPYMALEGIDTDLSWCKLYSAAAPVEGCEDERDTYLKQKEIMQSYIKSETDK